MATLDLSSGRKEQSVYIQACVRGAIDGDTFQVSPLVVPKAVRLILKSLPPRRRGALETMGDGMFQVVTTVIFLSICPNPLYGKHFFEAAPSVRTNQTLSLVTLKMFENHYRCRPDYDILKSPANLIELLIGALYKYGYWREAVRWIVAVFRPLALAAVDACRDIIRYNQGLQSIYSIPMSRTGNTAWKALILAHDTPYPDTLDYGEPSDVESLEEGECDANEQDSECHHVGKSLLLRISDHRVEDTYQDGRDDDGWEPQSIRDSGSRLPLVAYNHQNGDVDNSKDAGRCSGSLLDRISDQRAQDIYDSEYDAEWEVDSSVSDAGSVAHTPRAPYIDPEYDASSVEPFHELFSPALHYLSTSRR